MSNSAASRGWPHRLPAGTSVVAALLASSCCILPLILIVSGIAGAGIMMSMMQYEWLTLPLGVFGLTVAWTLYFRQQQHCKTEACQVAGRRTNLVMLGLGTSIVLAALLFRVFPSWSAAILQSIA